MVSDSSQVFFNSMRRCIRLYQTKKACSGRRTVMDRLFRRNFNDICSYENRCQRDFLMPGRTAATFPVLCGCISCGVMVFAAISAWTMEYDKNSLLCIAHVAWNIDGMLHKSGIVENVYKNVIKEFA